MLPIMVAVPDGPGFLGRSSGNKSVLLGNGSTFGKIEYCKKVHLIEFFEKEVYCIFVISMAYKPFQVG